MSSIRLKHASGNSMSLAAPGTNPASNLELKLPHTIGSANQLLKVDGNGQLGWADDNSGLSISNNADNRIVTGTGSALNAEANLTFDGSTLNLTGRLEADTITGPAGSAGNFSIASGHANTPFIFYVGQYGVSATEKLRISSGGKLTVTSNSEPQVDVQATSAAGASMRVQSAGAYAYYMAVSTNIHWRWGMPTGTSDWVLRESTNNRDRFWVDTGNGAYFKGVSHTNLEIRSNSSSTKALIQTVQDSDVRIGASTNHPLALYAGGLEKVRITSDGKIGIGTVSPTNNVHLSKANAGGDVSLRITNATNQNSGSTASLYFTTSPTVDFNTAYIQAVRDGGKLNFGYHSQSPTVCMRISTGNVGIGTSDPTPTDSAYDTACLHIHQATNSSSKGSQVHLTTANSGSAAGDGVLLSQYNNWFYLNNQDSGGMQYHSGGSERLRIDSSGRVLIGLNSNHANASIDDLQVGNPNSSTQRGITIGSADECAIAFSDAGDARAGSITYNHGTNMMLFKTDGQNTRFDMDNDNATFYPAASSTKSFQVRKNGTLNTQDKQCIASFWHSGGTTSSDKRYIGISSSPDGVYGCHVGSYNDGTNPSWLQPGFYVATGHNSYLAQDHSIRFKISSNGNFYGSSTTISSISDARLKKNITDYTYDLNKFKQLQPKTFEWINPAEHCDDVKRGFSAQEVEVVDDYWILEDRVQHDSKDAELLETDLIAKNSKLGELDAMYVSVINQLITKIETLETKVAALEAG